MKSGKEELRMEKQRLLSVQEVCITTYSTALSWHYSLTCIFCVQQKEKDEMLSAESQHIEELERQLECVNEELKLKKEKLLSLQEVC